MANLSDREKLEKQLIGTIHKVHFFQLSIKDLYSKFADLQSKLASAQEEVLKIRDELEHLPVDPEDDSEP